MLKFTIVSHKNVAVFFNCRTKTLNKVVTDLRAVARDKANPVGVRVFKASVNTTQRTWVVRERIGNNRSNSSGATVEQEIPTPFGRGDYITFNLIQSDFTTAQRLADAVNNFLDFSYIFLVEAVDKHLFCTI